MNRDELLYILDEKIKSIDLIHDFYRKNPQAKKNVLLLKKFQTNRLEKTHNDLLTDYGTKDAAKFFFSEVYGDKDFSKRDSDVKRFAPIMQKVLPVAAINTIVHALTLNDLTEKMDLKMLDYVGDCENITDKSYVDAFLKTDEILRRKQVKLIHTIGMDLCMLTKIPFLATTLKLMSGPAAMANLMDLHQFLSGGFFVFKNTVNPQGFITRLTQREEMIMNNIYSKKENPFVL